LGSTILAKAKKYPTPLADIEILYNGNEYVKEYYLTDWLNEVFPGWCTEEMETVYDEAVTTYRTQGHLVVEYLLPSGKMKSRRIYAIGANQVHSKTSDASKPSLPDDMAKGSFTEWLKIACKRLGFASDVYNQKPHKPLVNYLLAIVKLLPVSYNNYKKQIKQTTTNKGLRSIAAELPTPSQIQKIEKVIEKAKEYYRKRNTDDSFSPEAVTTKIYNEFFANCKNATPLWVEFTDNWLERYFIHYNEGE